MSEDTTTTPPPSSSASQGMDLVQAVWQLRSLVCGVGAALLILSVAFNLFVWKQNRNITAITQGRLQQVTLLDARVKQLTRVVSDLGNYSTDKPELMAIFGKYGLELRPTAPALKP
jgi:hypothetical protein